MFSNKFSIILCYILCSNASFVNANDWSKVSRPNNAPPEVIGGPAAGCVSGAATLATKGDGYQAMRLSRNRIYGHPSLVKYINNLGVSIKEQSLGMMLVGDLGQPRGGPTASLHRSHQNGLDVDIWYWLPEPRHFTNTDIEKTAAPSMVKNQVEINNWTDAQTQLLRLAAAPYEVDRIFVHPVIKKLLCDEVEDHSWLNKIRPWWNHDDHLHVRLRCPAHDEQCVPQKPYPPGDGCGDDLTWWLDAVAAPPQKKMPTPRPPNPVLPSACDAVLNNF